MLENVTLSDILFLDIETASQKATYSELSEDFRYLWTTKAGGLLKKPKDELTLEEVAISYPERAAIYAEFGKIICISVGILRQKDGVWQASIKSFKDPDEAQLLQDFAASLERFARKTTRGAYLCGHNIREFDIPYICRRMVVHTLPLPTQLSIYGKKPWEVNHFIDTLELWKFGDYKSFTSLKLLAAVLGFPSPKDDIDGSEVGRVYWEDKDLDRIAIYCEKDVLATIQLLLRFLRQPILTNDQVEFVGN